MSGYVNSLAQLNNMDWSEWEEVINWAAAEDDAAQVGFTPVLWCVTNLDLSGLNSHPVSESATRVNGFDGRFQSLELDSSGVSLDLDCILANGNLLDVSDCVEVAPSQVSGNHGSTSKPGVLNGTTTSRSSPLDSSARLGRQARGKRNQNLVCTYDGCDFKGSFPRPHELNRHIKAKHSADETLRCVFSNCIFSFVRLDKLTAHTRKCYDLRGDEKLGCPFDGCTVSLDLRMLNLHVRLAHRASFEEPGLLRAVATAGSTAYVQCPIEGACAWKRPQDIPLHLLKHGRANQASFMVYSHKILSRHYTLVDHTGLAATNVEQFGQLYKTATMIGIAVVCPMCQQPCDDHASFEAHFDEKHIIAQEQQDHFVAWRQYVQMSQVLKDNRAVRPWISWKLRKDWINVQCPSCDFYREKVAIDGSKRNLEVDHHLHMLANRQDLEPYRRAVLMLYPDFGSHPVWNDLAYSNNPVRAGDMLF